ncbi:MAG TPA: MerR family transcriptional regulator [Nocardioides sp.]|nr:MerR family transcriptional regulator [Nocardioides sp.]
MSARRTTPRGPGLGSSPYSREPNLDAAVYVISVAAELTGLHPQTLRAYERMGLIQPGRTGGGGRRYSHRDIERLREIADLTSAGIGIEGVRRIMQLELQVDALRARNEELLAELEALRSGLAARVAVQPTNKLPVLHQAVGQSVVVWRRGS